MYFATVVCPTSMPSLSNRRADRPDDPLPERLGEHPSRPVMRDLLGTPALIPAQQRAQCHGGEAYVEEGGSSVNGAARQRVDVVSVVIGIKQGLREATGGKAQEPGSDDGNEERC